MIVRKPYAFLIKNFRLIHFLMLLISLFLFYRISIAYNFFSDYVATRQFIENPNLINDTVSISIIIFSLLILSMCISILILFRKKDKPIFFYISSTIFYIFLIVLSFVSRGIISTIILEGLDPRISRIFRDLWRISYFLEIAVSGFCLVRTLGFDVKKFHFGEDVHQFQIEEEDYEEYEITSSFDADKIRMRSNMRKEELKSFYYENRFMIIIIAFFAIIVIPLTLISRNIYLNKRYSQNETITLKNYNFKVIDTYITKKSYNGDVLLSGSNSFLIVKFNISNDSDKEASININNLRLEINNKVYVTNTTFYEYFSDLGKAYNNQVIINDSKDYIALFVINDEDIDDQIIVRFTDRVTVKNNQANAKYYRVIAKPINLDRDSVSTNLNIKEQFLLNDIKLTINNFEIKDSYIYTSNNKNKYLVNSLGLILRLDYEYSGNNSYLTINDFLSNYGYIRYKIGNKTYNESINIITPSISKNNIYLAVKEDIKDADEIYLVINLRNNQCLYKLK